ncbi:MAG TPA: hypothetical protein PKC21_02140 [Oligoflexia bacterium]|nr:hypothetical protein [Oligoflexia bacterium]HMR24130.1 hypothetical protein [Oligoflexia bacterium]
MRVRNLKLWFYILAVSFVFSNQAMAIIVKSIGLDQMIEKAESVYIADVLYVSELKKDANGLEYNLIRIKVVKGYKKAIKNQSLEFKQVSQQQSESWKHLKLLPIPTYKTGQRVLFFMSKKSNKGYQMPIGFDQGKLLLNENPTKNINDSTIVLKENHKNFFKIKSKKIPEESIVKVQAIENKHQVFTVKDFENLFKDINP